MLTKFLSNFYGSAAECEERKKSQAELDQEELENIMRENPYAATDPEEMERILSKRNNKGGKRSPPQFSRMMLPIKMLTGAENNDGLKIDINLGLTQQFQIGLAWALSNKNPASVSLSAMAMFADPRTSSKMSYMNCKKDTGGVMELNSQFYLTDSISFKVEGLLPNDQVEMSHIGLEIMKEFNDCHIAYRLGGG
jgi:hypothetical protein